jgi:hypothetical protein
VVPLESVRENFIVNSLGTRGILKLIKKVRFTVSLLDKKSARKCRVFTTETLHETGARLEHIPKKSLRSLAQETGILKPLIHI